jgi:ABC-type phosphate/phosphonate transport system substrate-binding protein
MRPLLLGAVAYDPKVVSIWEGFRAWLRKSDFDFDFVLYSNYERQVEDLLDGRVDVAWNSPLAWVRARRIAAARAVEVQAVAMRDTDRDLVSVVVVRADSDFRSPVDLRGAIVAVGASDSPQATLLPLSRLRSAGLDPARELNIQPHDVGIGLHGDHIGGEREAAKELHSGRADAACMTDANLLLFGREGVLARDSVRVLVQTAPFDHCNMTAGPGADPNEVATFVSLLRSMSYADSDVRPLLDLEGLIEWLPARVSQYGALERAVDEAGFYDRQGALGCR